MAQTDMTADEVFESINGFEEIAVAKAFGADPTSLAASGKQIFFVRSLAFVVLKREKEMNDFIAKQTVMAMPVRELMEFFAEEEEEQPKPVMDSSSDEPFDLSQVESEESEEPDDSGESAQPNDAD